MKLELNGEWDFHPNDSEKGFPIVVPTWWDSLPVTTGYPTAWEKGLYHAVYRRTVHFDEKMFDEDIQLHVGALATLGKVFVNGVSVGPKSTKGYLMTLLPYDLNINAAAHPGDNEILIEVWSVKQLPEDALAPEAGPDKLLFPFGVENIVGRVGIGGDVYVQTKPKLRVDDVQLIPDLKKNADPSDDELTVNVTVVNHTNETHVVDVDVVVSPWAADSDGSSLPHLRRTAVKVAANGEEVVTLSALWPDAHYWSRTDPFLYVAAASIEENGAVAHSLSARFGFRQFYRVGDKYYLNGVKIRLRGDSLCLLNQGNRDLINEIGDAYGVILDDNHAMDAMASTWLDAYKHANANIVRNHIRSIPSQALYDHADEIGMLMEEETAFWNPGSVSNVSLNPPYYINYSDEAIGYYCEWVERWVREYRNHPSIVLWSTTNEAWNPNDETELVAPLEKAVLRNDVSRMVINDGFNKPITNEDSRHYFGGYPSGMTSAPNIYDLYQIDSDLPLGAGEEFSVSTAGIPQYAADGTIKDIYHGRLNGNPDTISRADFGRELGRVTRGIRTTRMMDWKPFCWSMFVYDNIERYIPLDQKSTKHGLNPKMLIRPQFDPTASGDARWIEGDGFEYFANSYADVAAFDKGFDGEPRLGLPHRIYQPGVDSDRTLIIYNDEEIDGTALNVSWKVYSENVNTQQPIRQSEGDFDIEVPHGEFREHEIVIRVPGQVEATESRLILSLEVRKNGKLKFHEDNFLGWIGRPAPAKIGVSRDAIDLGKVDWISRRVKHCIHLKQLGGALSEHWTAQLVDDANGSISLEKLEGNLRHEQEQFYTVNVGALESGREYSGKIKYTGEYGDSVTVGITFTAGDMPVGEDALNLAAGAKVSVSSASTLNGWTSASLVDGSFTADYNRFGWSSEKHAENRPEWVQLELSEPRTVSQVVLAPRGENPGGTVAEAFHGEGEGVGGVLEFAAGHKAVDPNVGQGFPEDFLISVSSDGNSWKTVKSCVDYPLPSNGKARAFDFAPVENVRFVKAEASKLRANPNENGEYAMQLAQVAVYAEAHMPTVPSAPGQVLLQVKDHTVHVSWQTTFDGRSALQGSHIILRNDADEAIEAQIVGDAGHVSIQQVPDGLWTAEVYSFNAIGSGEKAYSDQVAIGDGKTHHILDGADSERIPAPKVALQVPDGTLRVTWTLPAEAATSAVSFVAHLESVGVGQSLKRCLWVPKSASGCLFDGLPRGEYRIYIEVRGADGLVALSEYSEPTLVAQTPSQPNKPGVTSSGDEMKVTWSKPADGGARVLSYVLTLRNLTEGTSTVVKADGSEIEHVVSGLAPGNYTASVIAVNAIGMSVESSPSLPCIIR